MSKNKKVFRLGKHPKKADRRNLQLSTYLPKLPMPPSIVDRVSRLPKNIGMMANDQYGCCTMATAGHMVQSWSTYANRGTQTIPDEKIVEAYLAISPNDNGAYVLDALNYWRKTGVGGDNIEAFIEVQPHNITQAKIAIHYFGALYVGMALPDENTFGPWITPTGEPNRYNGHAVCLLAYNDLKKTFKVATWGEVWDMSYDWYNKYVDETYAVLNDISIIRESNLSPSGFAWDQLQADLHRIGDPVTEPVTPPPAPEPPPAHKPVPSMNFIQKIIEWILSLFKK